VTILLGTVDLPDGELVIIDPGLANFWRHAGNPASPLRRDPPCVDLLISGADAKVTGTTWDREFNPLAIYDAPKPDTLIAQFADFTKRHGFDASASECGCNMHGRRYFTKALDAGDARASLPLAAFKKLYDVEEEVRGRAPAIVLEVRQQKSRPVCLRRVAGLGPRVQAAGAAILHDGESVAVPHQPRGGADALPR
jgi:hypothetical protein